MSIDYRPDNTIIFTLARMNPPTPGHLYLIERLIEEGIQKNANKVYVILSKTNDNNENPIPCSEKINILGTAEDISKTMVKAVKEQMISKTSDEDMKKKISVNPKFIFFDSGGWTPSVGVDLQKKFVNLTRDSKFALAPRGYGRGSFRFFECFQLGTIPIYLWNDIEWLPFKNQIDYHKCCISIWFLKGNHSTSFHT